MRRRTPLFVVYGLDKKHWILFALCSGFALILYGTFYPSTHGIEDEVGFINQAFVLSKGSLSSEGAGLPVLSDLKLYNGQHVGYRNIGRSLLTAPFIKLFGLDAVFVPGLIIHLLLALLAALIFSHFQKSPLWALLILCHPTLSLYSRTVMGDTAAALGVLFAIYSVLCRKHAGLLAGVGIGFAAVMRYHAGILLPFLTIALFFSDRKDSKRQALYSLFSGGAIACALFFYNHTVYGNPLGIVRGMFGLHYFPEKITFYATALMVIWPGMLASLFMNSPIRRWVLFLCLPFHFTFLFYYFSDSSPVWYQTLVVGQRLTQAVLPLWILHYVFVLDNLLGRFSIEKTWQKAAFSFGAVTLLLSSFMIHLQHNRHLTKYEIAREEITKTVPEGATLFANSAATKVIGVPYDGLPKYSLNHFFNLKDNVDDFPETVYLALLSKKAGRRINSTTYAGRELIPLPSKDPYLQLYRLEPKSGASRPLPKEGR